MYDNGYDDMLVRSNKRIDNDYDDWKRIYEIFLGGERMDTIPALEMHYDHFALRVMNKTNSNSWAMLPDLNADGADDLGLRPILPERKSTAYPNPFNDIITIDVKVINNQNVDLQIYDIAGKLTTAKFIL